MKDIVVENFNYSNVKEWIGGYTHKQKVEFAVYCAELVIHLYNGSSDAPSKASKTIEAAKEWILNPSKENKKKCKDAAHAAVAAHAAYAADVAHAAAHAAHAAAYAAYAADVAAHAAYAAYAADVAAHAAYAGKSVKEKIVDYLLGNQSKPRTRTEYVKVTESIFDLKEEFERGELYFAWLGNPDPGSNSVGYDRITDEKMLLCRYEEKRLLRRIETPITEREEFIETYAWAVQDDISNIEDIAGMLFDSGKFKLTDKE